MQGISRDFKETAEIKITTAICIRMERKHWDLKQVKFLWSNKKKYTFENYLDFIDNRQHKAALTKLRISAHRLHIETGRYKRYDYNLRRYINNPSRGTYMLSLC